jgi:hypothetical protein
MAECAPGRDLPVDPEIFWRLGPLPPASAASPVSPVSPVSGLDLVGRPEITVDGRNLADVLVPVYRALVAD